MSEVITIDVNPDSKSKNFSTRWWTEKPDEMHTHVFGTVRMLEQRQSYRTQENIKHARLYSDLEVLGVYAGLYSPVVKDQIMANRLSLNVVQSNVDTVTSKIAKSKPRPMFLTEDGDFKLRQKAKRLTKYLDGQFDSMDHYEVKQDTFRDNGVFGTGATKFYIDWIRNRICSERTIIEELLVDDAEGLYGKPRTLFQRRLVNKDVLAAACPKYKKEIYAASSMLEDSFAYSSATKDLVRVIEAWHLPSGKDTKDGKHVICINNATIEIEDWEFDWFPFSFERWNKSLVGFWGIGIARELTGIQVEINKILRRIQQSMELFSIPRVFVENSSQVNLAAINNDIGAIIKYTSNAPQFYVPQAMSPDTYQHLWNLYAKSFEKVGVSQLSATSKKPDGLDSGKALREYSDIESDRFQIVSQRRETSFLFDAKITIELSKKLAKKNGDYKVKVSDQGSMQTIRFSDVHMDEEKYMMRVFPASIFPTQPAARMETIVEYSQAGFLDKDTAMDLMDFPDIQAATNMQISPRRLVLKQLDQMVETGKYQTPEPYMDLKQTKQLAQYYYLNAKMQGVPEDRLDLIRNYMTQTVNLITQSTPPMPAIPGLPMPAGGPSPIEQAMPANPEPLPTNDILAQGA